jgi:glycerophosphoryl diester phosphodiesterase
LDESGANAIEIDLSVSKDGVIFLWHDPQPLGILSLVRRSLRPGANPTNMEFVG